MNASHPIPLPLPHVGSINVWLLRGDPLTLVDTGPRSDEALSALENGLLERAVRLEDIELVLATHHHLDHVGLAATIQRRAGARVAGVDGVARYGERYADHVAADRTYSRELMAAHGVPDQVIADNEGFWDYISSTTEDFRADVRLTDGDRIVAGGRTLRVVARPGHSTTDTLFVDDDAATAFVGDHLLAGISSNTEISPAAGAGRGRPRPRVQYLENLRRTAGMPLDRLLTGHGGPVCAHSQLVQARLAEHRSRCERIAAVLGEGPATAFAVAGRLWSAGTVFTQPLLVVWEVLGHLDLLIAAGVAVERPREDGRSWFSLSPRDQHGCPSAGGDRPAQLSRHAH